MYRLGFMQGRLSPKVGGRIQAFPRDHWEQEFSLAHANDWQVMEWTIDQEGFDENPVMTVAGRERIHQLMEQYQVTIPSVTADFAMQAPFYKAARSEAAQLLSQLQRFLACAAEIGVRRIVIPLVDNGAIRHPKEEAALRQGLAAVDETLHENNQTIVFESDFEPSQLATFIASFTPALYGINYDSGNSASLGYNVSDEFAAYGQYIKNVHIKDRVYQGTTVPLGTGDTDFYTLFTELKKIDYQGNLIFQTARAENEDHIGVLNHYRSFIKGIMTAWT